MIKYQLSYEYINNEKYYKMEGQKLPSVTSVLSKTAKKDWLVKWQNKIGINESNKITQNATKRGKYIHKVIENTYKNIKIDLDDEYQGYYVSLFNILQWIDKVELSEGCVWTDDFAGRVDMIANFNGILSIIDFKTSTSFKKKEWIEDYFLQVAAYRQAIKSVYNLQINQGVIAIAVHNDNPQIFIMSELELDYKYKLFEERLKFFLTKCNLCY